MSSSSRKSRLATSVARVMYTNAVYFPNSRIYQGDTPGMLNYSCINHVYYAYASVSLDGGVFVSLSTAKKSSVIIEEGQSQTGQEFWRIDLLEQPPPTNLYANFYCVKAE